MKASTPLKAILLASSLAAGLPAFTHAAGMTPVGHWQLFDENSKQPYAMVEISENQGEYLGHIRKVFPQPGEDPNPLCTQCSGELKNKPMLGMRILSGLRQEGDRYDNGVILDPDEGKTYRCRITVLEGGKKLAVLFYLGSTLFGYTDTWLREGVRP